MELNIFKEKPLGDGILAVLSLQLSSLLKAGIPLVSAFEIIIKNDHSKKPYLKAYRNVIDSLRAGSSFSDALKASNGKFPDIMIHMVSASEQTGNLSGAMAKLSNYFTRQHTIKTKISNAVVYPKLIFAVMTAVLIILTVFVIPRFADIFSDYDNIPPTTEFLFSLSDFISNNFILLIAALLFLYIFLKILSDTNLTHRLKDKIKVKLPYIGALHRTVYTARFADTFSSLHSCGVDVTTAVQTSSYTIGNIYLESQFKEVLNKISFGVSLSEAIYQVDGFDGNLADIIKIGEESGELENMLDVISEKLNTDAQTAISKMLTLIEPAVIIILSLIVLFVMMAVLIPMLDSYALLENSIII